MYKLLIVDDEIEIRNGLTQYFPWHEFGFTVVGQCENGKKALDYIDAHPVDVVLCDIKMPIMSGIELAEHLHTHRPEIHLIFLSGYRDFEYAKQALMFNVKDYIVKPTMFDELSRVFTSVKQKLDEEHAESDPVLLSFNEKVIAEIKAYVEQRYREATLSEASSLVHLSPYYVSKYFKEHTGQKFSDYLVSVRMKKAAELLMDIRYKTYEVSEMVGYSHAKNFTRTFKRYYGMSPREFRNEKNRGRSE